MNVYKKEFIKEEDGNGAIEIALVIAGIVILLLIFKDDIIQFFTKARGIFFSTLDVGDNFR